MDIQPDIWDEEPGQEDLKEAHAAIEQIGRFLKNRDYFTSELILKLRQKSHSREEIDKGLAYYRELGLLNDEELAYRYALSRLSKEGPNKVLARLIAKGVRSESARCAVQKALEEGDSNQEEQVREQVRSMLEGYGLNIEELDYKTKQKLAQRLYNKGYETHLIIRLLEL